MRGGTGAGGGGFRRGRRLGTGRGPNPARIRREGGRAVNRQSTTEVTYREAVREGLRDALRADPRVFLMGEDVGAYGGCYAVSKGLLQEFGPERIRDAPLSEAGF